jgi:hypothetical protein
MLWRKKKISFNKYSRLDLPIGFCTAFPVGGGRFTLPVKGFGEMVGTAVAWWGPAVGCTQTSTKQHESLGSVFIVHPGVKLVNVEHLKTYSMFTNLFCAQQNTWKQKKTQVKHFYQQ